MQATTTRLSPAISTGTAPAGADEAVAAMMRAGSIPGLSIAVVDRDRL